jgi:outer membrane protein OmpA-like peptidoglycan-associated protein
MLGSMLCAALGTLDVAVLDLKVVPEFLLEHGATGRSLPKNSEVDTATRRHPSDVDGLRHPVSASELDLTTRPSPSTSPTSTEIEPHRLVIEFSTNSTLLSPEAIRVLEAVLPEVADGATLEIEGHADARGSADRNLELSRERAAAVAGLFEKGGVERSRLRLSGHGGAIPRDQGHSAEANARNRRVEVAIRRPGLNPH